MNEATAELKRHLRHYVLGTTLLSIPCFVVAGWLGWRWFWTDFAPGDWVLSGTVMGVVFALTFNQFLFGACLSTLKSRRGEKPQLRDFFSQFGLSFGPVLMANLITGLSLVVGLLFCLVGGLATSSLLFLALPAAATGQMSGLGAIEWSWKTLKRSFLSAFAICNTVHLAAVSGGFLFCLGGVFTMALYPIAQAILYERMATSLEPQSVDDTSLK